MFNYTRPASSSPQSLMTAIVRDNVDEKRRRLLLIATGVAAGAAGAGTAVPFVASWFPSARALAAGAPVEFDISQMGSGRTRTGQLGGKSDRGPLTPPQKL